MFTEEFWSVAVVLQ